MPGTGKVMIDREALLNLIDEMRASIPEDLQHAQEVLGARESLLAEAKGAVERMRREADDHFRQRTDQHEVVLAARKEAQEIVARARGDAQRELAQVEEDIAARKRELDEYSLGLLRRLEGSLNANLGQIRQGIEGLLEKQRRAGPSEEDNGL